MSASPDAVDPMYTQGLDQFRSYFQPGEKVTGKVTGMTSSVVFLDIHAKSEGILERAELTDEEGNLQVAEGDEIEAFFVRMHRGEIILTVKMGASGSETDDSDIVSAFQSGIPIEGKVESECKGGFDVSIGRHRAFCPFSQMGMFPVPDTSVYIGQRLTFLISEYDGDRNLVVSRRSHLEAENAARREKLRETLKEGAIVEGVITRVKDFGAFIDIGGVEGLIPISEMAWGRVENAEDIVSVGERVSVYVNRIDWEKDRFSFSLRRSAGDPWDTVEESFHVGGAYAGEVTRLMPFGAFVMLKPGVEGLLHISKLGAGKRLGHPREVLEEGAKLEVHIENIDYERQRISLTLENPQQGRKMEVDGGSVTIGATVTGTVEDIKPFGIFVRLPSEQTGLLHISELDLGEQVNRQKAMYKLHPPGSEIEVCVTSVQDRRISLSLPGRSDEEDDYRELLHDEDSESLGNLGDLFSELKL